MGAGPAELQVHIDLDRRVFELAGSVGECLTRLLLCAEMGELVENIRLAADQLDTTRFL